MEKFIVTTFLRLKELLKVQAWVLESTFVLTTLLLTALLSGKGWVEYIAVLAVYFTFKHASVSERLREANDANSRNASAETVACAPKLNRFFYMKEVLWVAFFLLSGSWSALAGCVVFLLYGWWRAAYRKHHPKKPKPTLRRFYRHFKHLHEDGVTGCYELTGYREFTETGEMHVDYRPCYKKPNYVKACGLSRTERNFRETVMLDGKEVPRFTRIGDERTIAMCIEFCDILYND